MSGVDDVVVPQVWQRICAALGPGIAAQAGPLFVPLVRALASQLEDVSAVVADEGVESFYDLDRTPFPGWLGQWVGVDYDPNTSRAMQIGKVRSRGQTRGTPDALIAGVQALLTGDRVVQLDERDTSAYHLTLRTITTETPDVAAARAAARAAKPYALVMAFGWVLRPDNMTGWRESVTQSVYACPVPSENLLPSEELLPC